MSTPSLQRQAPNSSKLLNSALSLSQEPVPHIARPSSCSNLPHSSLGTSSAPTPANKAGVERNVHGSAISQPKSPKIDNSTNQQPLSLHRGGRASYGRRYVKSTGARSSTFSKPVIVRTYCGPPRPQKNHQTADGLTNNGRKPKPTRYGPPSNMKKKPLKLPPVEAFGFNGIMDEIKHSVLEDLERIAEICAKSRYSLSNQYEVHMPPHGQTEVQFVPSGDVSNSAGRTLQAIRSDDENVKVSERKRVTRRVKSTAHGTLETIRSSSRSSDEDNSTKQSAAVIAEQVRGRVARKDVRRAKFHKNLPTNPSAILSEAAKFLKSSSAALTSMTLLNDQSAKHDARPCAISANAICSSPARPEASIADVASLTFSLQGYPVISGNRVSTDSRLGSGDANHNASETTPDASHSGMRSLSTWTSWIGLLTSPNPERHDSHAEISLRHLLASTTHETNSPGHDASL